MTDGDTDIDLIDRPFACIANRWRCDLGHEWTTAHGAAWLEMPTTCPKCHTTATAHKGEFVSFRQIMMLAQKPEGT